MRADVALKQVHAMRTREVRESKQIQSVSCCFSRADLAHLESGEGRPETDTVYHKLPTKRSKQLLQVVVLRGCLLVCY